MSSLPAGVVAQPGAVVGSIAGKVVDRESGSTLSGVTVKAHVITENRRLPEAATDANGAFLVPGAPAGVYAFTLSYHGEDYRVQERLDARAGMSFLLESCFVLDQSKKIAAVSREPCRSGFVPEAQVVALGANRYFRPSRDIGQAPAQGPGPQIQHDALECYPRNQFPILDADVSPGRNARLVRVYFRAGQQADFYYVDMHVADSSNPERFETVLPRPSAETQEVVYYVEALDDQLLSSRTGDIAAQVADDDACRRRDPGLAWFQGENPGIIVGSPVAGAASVPPGFLPGGIAGFVDASGVYTALGAGAAATGGGGLGTTGLVLIIGGAAAATGAVIIATGEEQPTNQQEASSPK